MREKSNLLGKRFERLLVIKMIGLESGVRTDWLCQCDCGNQAIVKGDRLLYGNTKSCGCLAKDVKATAKVTHGMSYSYLYATWRNMKARCHNSNHGHYKNYGGRGITVCPEWKDSFETFYKDMGPRPSPDHSIDRIDPNGNYEPSNCRWATRKEQARNRRTNRLEFYEGKLRTIMEISELTNIDYGTIWRSLKPINT